MSQVLKASCALDTYYAEFKVAPELERNKMYPELCRLVNALCDASRRLVTADDALRAASEETYKCIGGAGGAQ